MQDAQIPNPPVEPWDESNPGSQPEPPASPVLQEKPKTEAQASPKRSPPEERPEEALSKNAIEKRLRRVFQARADGTYLVSEDFIKQYKSKGEDRNALMVMFEKCDYKPDKGLPNYVAMYFP